jgi:squalene-hopene/tetraprenyl-beta-curcumene cyclase
MTYAGFKSMLYSGLTKDDPRVKRAMHWIRSHWTLDANPNMPPNQGKQGLFYYYHVFAKACSAWGNTLIIDGEGRPRHWRIELIDKLGSIQNKDGSWVNDEDRWAEGDPNYVTALTVLALQQSLTD